eukprot:TRINITY_DN1065_c0_g1_i2.p1 TRINITY_DN1065_c0_g1~~TRINITY_DN1065_c0_g1_i2.p1  ORF type:complete len:430 (-),score=76.12 TRINITY_DN1065_c0_g1_i2:62-1351(-)
MSPEMIKFRRNNRSMSSDRGDPTTNNRGRPLLIHRKFSNDFSGTSYQAPNRRRESFGYQSNTYRKKYDDLTLDKIGVFKPLLKSCAGFWVEVGHDISQRDIYTTPIEVENTASDRLWYNDLFSEEEHKNYIGKDKDLGVFILSIMVTEKGDHNNVNITALLRTKRHDIRRTFIVKKDKKFSRHVLKLMDVNISCKKLKCIHNLSIVGKLRKFERKLLIMQYKIGVLYCREGQTTEEEMFSNEHGSPAFNKFLRILGDKIDLLDWEEYRAGLDVKHNSTGEHSIYTQWRDYEIMYHVATMLPYNSYLPQQLDRKRHLGNDIVLIIFKEGNLPYVPNRIASEFNQVIIVVQPVVYKGDTFYRISCGSKFTVHRFGPELPGDNVIYPHGELARDFIIAKAINGERAAYGGKDFVNKIVRTRQLLLETIEDEY